MQDVILSVIPPDDIHPALFLTSRNFAMRLAPRFYQMLYIWPERLSNFGTACRRDQDILLALTQTQSLFVMIDTEYRSIEDLEWLVGTL